MFFGFLKPKIKPVIKPLNIFIIPYLSYSFKVHWKIVIADSNLLA